RATASPRARVLVRSNGRRVFLCGSTWGAQRLAGKRISCLTGEEIRRGVRAGQVTRTSRNRRTAWCVPGPNGPLAVNNTIGVRGRKPKFVEKSKSLRKKRGLTAKPQNSCRTSREQTLFSAAGPRGPGVWARGPIDLVWSPRPRGGGKARAFSF